jgi:hypothetical protein
MEAKEEGDGLATHAGCRYKANEIYPLNFASRFFVYVLIFLTTHCSLASLPKDGFFLPDHVQELTFKFQKYGNLILLPVTINDTIQVNLILDTGCRNLLLFGKRFEKLFKITPGQKIQIAGLGDGQSLLGKISLDNKVSIHAVLGEKIPIVIVANQNLFSKYSNVHGIIGYDIFIKFEIEFNSISRLITFRPAAVAEISSEYTKIPLRIEDTRPLIQSTILFSDHESLTSDLMLDTGSSLGLFLKANNKKISSNGNTKKILGSGLNGSIMGSETRAEKIILETFEIKRTIIAGVTWSPWYNDGSVGMEIMKDYTIVLNYCKAYAGFKKVYTKVKSRG